MDHHWLTLADSSLRAQIIHDKSGSERANQLNGLFGVAEDVASLEVVHVEVAREAQAYLHDCTAHSKLDLIVGPSESLDANKDVLGHQEQVFLLNKNSAFDLGSHAVTNQGSLLFLHVVGDRDAHRSLIAALGQAQFVENLDQAVLVRPVPTEEPLILSCHCDVLVLNRTDRQAVDVL